MKKRLKNITKLLVLVLLFSIMLGTMLTVSAEAVAIGGTAKTTASFLNFRKGAAMGNNIIGVLPKGTEVNVLEKSGSWYKISLKDGRIGYVYNTYLTGIEKPAAAAPTEEPKKEAPKFDINKLEKEIVLATTTSTQDTGLLDTLVPAFEKKYGVSVKVISVGTGAALELGKNGDADVVLVHSRKVEDEFIADGYGVNRKDVMYNFFFLVGPKNDPAKVTETKDAASAMSAIAKGGYTFISRGDKSGTHNKELSVWDVANIKPQGQKWYFEIGQGMADTLMMANEKGGYTLVDSGTWYAFQDKVNMKIVLQGDAALFNPYGVMAVNPAKHSNIHYNTAMAFVEYITSEEGQTIIKEYKKGGYQLFVPDAR